MKIPTQFLTDYLFEKHLDWEAFEGFSSIAESKKDLIVANWRFADHIDSEDVKKILKAFKGVHVNGKIIEELSYEDFMKAYLNQ